MTKVILKLFLDEGVPNAVGRIFFDAGHEVIFLRDCIPTGSPDDLVCVAAEANEAILVACDGDMKQLIKPYGITSGRFKKLSLIKISCDSPNAATRVKEAMSLIEHEWNNSQNASKRRIFIEIMKSSIKINR